MSDLTTAGAVYLATACINDSPTFFSSGVNAAQGSGNGGGTAFAIGQTDNQGASKERVVATVTRAVGNLTFVSTFGTTVGNYLWSEIGIFNSPTTGGTMLCRKVQSPDLGTKNNTQVWVLTTVVAFTAT